MKQVKVRDHQAWKELDNLQAIPRFIVKSTSHHSPRLLMEEGQRCNTRRTIQNPSLRPPVNQRCPSPASWICMSASSTRVFYPDLDSGCRNPEAHFAYYPIFVPFFFYLQTIIRPLSLYPVVLLTCLLAFLRPSQKTLSRLTLIYVYDYPSSKGIFQTIVLSL